MPKGPTREEDATEKLTLHHPDVEKENTIEKLTATEVQACQEEKEDATEKSILQYPDVAQVKKEGTVEKSTATKLQCPKVTQDKKEDDTEKLFTTDIFTEVEHPPMQSDAVSKFNGSIKGVYTKAFHLYVQHAYSIGYII